MGTVRGEHLDATEVSVAGQDGVPANRKLVHNTVKNTYGSQREVHGYQKLICIL